MEIINYIWIFSGLLEFSILGGSGPRFPYAPNILHMENLKSRYGKIIMPMEIINCIWKIFGASGIFHPNYSRTALQRFFLVTIWQTDHLRGPLWGAEYLSPSKKERMTYYDDLTVCYIRWIEEWSFFHRKNRPYQLHTPTTQLPNYQQSSEHPFHTLWANNDPCYHTSSINMRNTYTPCVWHTRTQFTHTYNLKCRNAQKDSNGLDNTVTPLQHHLYIFYLPI